MKTRKSRTAIVRIVCPDQKGLAARFTGFLAHHNLNILDSEDHGEGGKFFQRIMVDITTINVSLIVFERRLEKECSKIGATWEVIYTDHPERIAIFVSRESHCLYELLIEHERGDLLGVIDLIISNHLQLEKIAKDFKIPFFHFPIDQTKNRKKQEDLEIALLKSRKIDLVVLARYMQILSPKFVRMFQRKIINVHHSFLPAFPGKNPYTQAYARGVKSIGATAHYVTETLDDGPYICQETVPCTHRDTPTDLRRKGRHAERRALLSAVTAHLDGRLFVQNGKRVIEL